MTDDIDDTGPRCAIDECSAGRTTHIAHCNLCGNAPCPRHSGAGSRAAPTHEPVDNVVRLASTGYAKSNDDIVDMIHAVADAIDSGLHGTATNVVMLLSRPDGSVHRWVIGSEIDRLRLLGLLAHVTNDVLNP